MEITKSGKGFYRYTFWDSLQECELTEASVTDKSEPHIWFGRKRSEHLVNYPTAKAGVSRANI